MRTNGHGKSPFAYGSPCPLRNGRRFACARAHAIPTHMLFDYFPPGKRAHVTQHCDLYVVRLLPGGRPTVSGAPCDAARCFGFSKPCVRCLRTLDIFGVHRVIFSTGEATADGEIGCEVRVVAELLAAAVESGGHCSRGDRCAVASGAVRSSDCGGTTSEGRGRRR